MEKLPKVSIISVFHNRESTALDSIQSLLNQTYQNLEIIIVDDLSTDKTFQIIMELCSDDNRVKIIKNNPNKGFTRSLIDVIKDLESDYVAIHGAGDISLQTRIEVQADFLNKNTDVGVVSVGVVNRAHNNISSSIKELKLKDFLKRNVINHGTAMFRLSDYRKTEGYRPFFIQRQDKDLWYRMILVTKIYFLPDKLYVWVKQDNSVSTETGKSMIPSLISEFATFLIRERIKYGYDSLDKFGQHAGLLFNPSLSNHIFFKDFRYNFIRGRFKISLNQLDGLIKINNSLLILPFLYMVKWLTFTLKYITRK